MARRAKPLVIEGIDDAEFLLLVASAAVGHIAVMRVRIGLRPQRALCAVA